MKKIKIEDEEILKQIQKLDEDGHSAQALANHAGRRLELVHEQIFKILKENIPEARGWNLRLDRDKKEIVLLYREEKEE